MDWLLNPIKNHYADFDGRTGRKAFWLFTLWCWAITMVLDTLHLDIFSFIFTLGVLVPSIAMGTRRLHDINRSGWWQLLMFLPIIGWIILLVWFVTKSDVGANKYGEAEAVSIVSSNETKTETETEPVVHDVTATAVDNEEKTN